MPELGCAHWVAAHGAAIPIAADRPAWNRS